MDVLKNLNLNIDEEFWKDFVQEAYEHVEDIEANVLTLEKNPENQDIINSMFRAFHTIKGLSGFVEHVVIQEIAHRTETLMDFCRKGETKVNTDIIDVILKSSDYIKGLSDDIDAWKDEALIAKIEVHIEKLDDMVEAIERGLKGEVSQELSPQEEPHVVVEEQSFVQEEPQYEQVQEEQVLSNEAESQFSEEIQEEYSHEQPTATEEQAEEDICESCVSAADIDVDAFMGEDFSVLIKDDVEEGEQEDSDEGFGDVVNEQSGETFEIYREERPDLDEQIATLKGEVYQKPEVVQESVTEEKASGEKLSSEQVKAIFAKPDAQQTDSTSNKAKPQQEEYMKVANSRIDHLVDVIGELIISQSLIKEHVASNYSHDNQFVKNLDGLSRITRELQDMSTFLRSISLKSTFQKISRIARDTINELGKDIEFVTSGESTEIDRVVADKLLDPLVHLIKNAISHGVEVDPQERINHGKNPRARVELNAYNKRGKIYIEIKDDGRGINTEVVYNKAVEKGLVDLNRQYSEDEIKEFILLPGFSTAEKVDNISGRGVGMDVVKTHILKIGGKVHIKSELHEGSTFTLEVPVNHAIMNGIIIDVYGQQFIIPTVNVKEILEPEESQWIYANKKRKMINVRDTIMPLVPIDKFFNDLPENYEFPLVILLEMDREFRALPITSVLNRQEVVVKPASDEFAGLKYLSGMSILGNGRVSLILDISYMFQMNNISSRSR